MNKINSNNLIQKLKINFYNYYFIYGNNLFLLQESIEFICKQVKKINNYEIIRISLNNETNWEKIFFLLKSYNLFSLNKIFIFTLSEHKVDINNIFIKIISLCHKDIIIISIEKTLNYIKKNNLLIKYLSKKDTLFVCCNTPNKQQLKNWILNRAKNMNLCLDNYVCNILCYYYEENLLLLNNIFEFFSLISINNKLSLSIILKIVNYVYNFTPYHWITSIFNGKIIRSNNIIKQLRLMDNDPLFLLKCLQKEIILLLKFKHLLNIKKSTKYLLKKNLLRKILLLKLSKQVNLKLLHNVIIQIINIESFIKKNLVYDAWFYLNKITHLLCIYFYKKY